MLALTCVASPNRMKYYNNCIFFNVQKDFIIQSGDPTGTGKGGDSVFKCVQLGNTRRACLTQPSPPPNRFLYGDQARFFDDEITPKLKHSRKGAVGCASAGPNLNASSFYITCRDDVDALDERNTVFGQVSEGLDVVDRINEAYCDDSGRPWINLRIHHAVILDDPFPDPPGFVETLVPPQSPQFVKTEDDGRLEDDWQPGDEARDPAEVEKELARKEAKSRAVVLEMIGDLPEADAKPPDDQLFVCKLNPVTTDEDLEIIFSRFGKVTQCDIIRDYKTGDSLCYAFVTFDTHEAAEAAYLKMDNVLIDDRRIHVDFSQSMHDLWRQFKRHGKKGGRAENAQYAEQDKPRGGRIEYKTGGPVLATGPWATSGRGRGHEHPQGGRGRGDGGRGGPRAEDWPCPRCRNLCFGFRTECNRCGTAKGAHVDRPTEASHHGGERQRRDERERDDRRERHHRSPSRERERRHRSRSHDRGHKHSHRRRSRSRSDDRGRKHRRERSRSRSR